MAQPRLIECIDFDRPAGGSFIPMVRALLTEARSRGWSSEALVPHTAAAVPWLDDLRNDGVKVHVAPDEGDLKLGKWLGEIVDAGSPHALLHSHFHGFDEAGWLVARTRPHLALIWHVHSTFSRGPTRIARAMLKLGVMGRRVDAILCPADNICQSTIRRAAPRGRVHFEPSAIDVKSFPLAEPQQRIEAKKSLGLDPERPIIGHFGWHWHLKGGDVFLESIRALVDSGHDEVVAVERGGHEEYTRYAEQLGIADRLVVLPPADEIWTLHAAMDVLVCSSRKEGMAYATVEALATGTPVVATEIPGHAYLAEHMDACRATGHDPAQIAERIAETFARPPEVAFREAVDGRRWIAENLDIRGAAARLLDRFENVMRARA